MFESMIPKLRAAMLDRGARIQTPFGSRLLCYADLTATGRLLEPVEAYIAQVSRYYANSHTLISSTGAAMTALREQARSIIARSVNAGPEDVLMFVGSGATAAVNKLVGLLGLRLSDRLEQDFHLLSHIPEGERPVVFVGPYEHHSNELPWLESVAQVVEVGLTPAGTIDLEDLQKKLAAHSSRPLKIGAFSAGSNVTGILSDVPSIARALHRHGALAFFDYAAVGPYAPIDMHPPGPGEHLDAIFLSPHKFVGGPQGSGVLVASRSCFRCRTPERPGGGTVDYVSAASHDAVDYVHRLDEREEGGTPAILGDIRAAAALAIKEDLDPARLLSHEVQTSRRVLERLARHPRIRVLGPTDLPRLPIIALNIQDLHHDLVSALLDHLFGIQNRAGCACAGPYGHRLLGIDRATSEDYRGWIARGVLGMKPGWVRISVPYYASEEEVDFILSALELVAEHGQAFVPLYTLNWRDGVWRHREGGKISCALPPLEVASFWNADLPTPIRAGPSDAEMMKERAGYLDDALRIARELAARWKADPPRWNPGTGVPELERLVWFKYVHSEELPARR